jgi:hypothetical protein
MTKRRQALCAGKPAATSLFLGLIPIVLFTTLSALAPSVLAPSVLAPSVLAVAPASSGAGLLILMGAFTLVFWHCHRRDDTSPRRVGRRI